MNCETCHSRQASRHTWPPLVRRFALARQFSIVQFEGSGNNLLWLLPIRLKSGPFIWSFETRRAARLRLQPATSWPGPTVISLHAPLCSALLCPALPCFALAAGLDFSSTSCSASETRLDRRPTGGMLFVLLQVTRVSGGANECQSSCAISAISASSAVSSAISSASSSRVLPSQRSTTAHRRPPALATQPQFLILFLPVGGERRGGEGRGAEGRDVTAKSGVEVTSLSFPTSSPSAFPTGILAPSEHRIVVFEL